MRNFLDLEDHGRDGVMDLLALAGRVLGLLFFNPSLRTLASMRIAMAKLGGESVVTMTGTAAEHIREAIPVLDSYCDALGVRAFAEGRDLAADLGERTFTSIASLCRNPLINLESSANHPCQALADWKTLDDLGVPPRGHFVLSWANHPRALPLAVPAAVSQMAAMRGMDVVVLRPEGYALPPQVMQKARDAAAQSGGIVSETDDRDAALAGAHVVYAKEWGSTANYGDTDADARTRAGLGDWMLKESWFARAQPDCHLMHCLPVRRNVAIADELLDGPRSRVLQQAHNRLTVQMAVLYRLLGKEH